MNTSFPFYSLSLAASSLISFSILGGKYRFFFLLSKHPPFGSLENPGIIQQHERLAPALSFTISSVSGAKPRKVVAVFVFVFSFCLFFYQQSNGEIVSLMESKWTSFLLALI